jgi:hypothetical protein
MGIIGLLFAASRRAPCRNSVAASGTHLVQKKGRRSDIIIV